MSAALEGRDELQHGLPAAEGKQVMHPMHLEETQEEKEGKENIVKPRGVGD